MRFLSATRLFSGNRFSETSILVVDNKGTITDLLPAGQIEPGRIERYEGILCAGFINTHCHLELSHLKGHIPRHTGIVDFGLAVVKHRNNLPPEAQLEHMQEADREMHAQGIVAVGDISNTGLSADVKAQSALYYHSFVELIALNPARATQVFSEGLGLVDTFQRQGLSASPAPHAPYSCSPELIRLIAGYCEAQRQPTSIHNQESRAENEFFLHQTGDYLRLYETLGLPLGFFSATGKSSLQSISHALPRQANTLLVHNTFTGPGDLEHLLDDFRKLYWCLCPQANLYIENTLPDAAMLAEKGCTLTMGTDSLASNSGLSILQEIITLRRYKPQLSLETLLEAATINGARFLGIDARYGSLEKGKAPGINVIDPEKGSVRRLA